MRPVSVVVANAFVDGDDGGNPAGVVLDAEDLSPEEKQFVATRVGFSETAFVSPSAVADYRLEFFTPVRQIDDCGHATVATFSYLVQSGRLSGAQSSKETAAGRRDIFFCDDNAFMEQPVPRYLPAEDVVDFDPGRITRSLGLDLTDLLEGHRPVIANNGDGCLIVPVASEAVVRRVEPDLEAIEEISRRLDLVEFYVFSPDTRKPGRDAGARMFAPLIGIPEESATGMAAGPLACFLHDFLNAKQAEFVIEQGHLMNPPSPSKLLVKLSIDNGRIHKVLVGGRARVTDRIKVDLA